VVCLLGRWDEVLIRISVFCLKSTGRCESTVKASSFIVQFRMSVHAVRESQVWHAASMLLTEEPVEKVRSQSAYRAGLRG
jgi:hypothetical protein